MKKAKNIWYYIKNYKTNSLFPRMLIFIFAILAIPLITLSTVFYNNLYHTIKEEMILENGAALKRAQNVTDSILNECDLLSSYIGNHDSAQFFTMDTFQGETLGDLTQFTKVLPLIYRYIDSVYVYSESNQLIFDNSTLYGIEEFADNGWLQQYHTLSDRRGCIIAREKKNFFLSFLPLLSQSTSQIRSAVPLYSILTVRHCIPLLWQKTRRTGRNYCFWTRTDKFFFPKIPHFFKPASKQPEFP